MMPTGVTINGEWKAGKLHKRLEMPNDEFDKMISEINTVVEAPDVGVLMNGLDEVNSPGKRVDSRG